MQAGTPLLLLPLSLREKGLGGEVGFSSTVHPPLLY
jgi:hypothetical protein